MFRRFELSASLAVSLLLLATSADATQRAHEFTGVLEKVFTETFIVKQGNSKIEFTRMQGGMDILEKAQIGDPVTVLYTLETKKILLGKSTKQLPGKAVPRPTEEPSRDNIILDDRAFYPAQNKTDAGEDGHGKG